MSGLVCWACGSAMDEGSRFCGSCGRMVEQATTPLSEPAVGLPGSDLPPPVVGSAPTMQMPSSGSTPDLPPSFGGTNSPATPPRRSRNSLLVVGALAVVGVAVAAFVVLGGGDESETTIVTATSAEPATNETEPATTEPAPTFTAVETTTPTSEATITTPAPTTTAAVVTEATTPSGLLVVLPDTVPDSVCTKERIEADTGLVLSWEAYCIGAWSLNMQEGMGGSDEVENEGADVFRWTGFEWQYRRYHYAMCDIGLTYAGMPPVIAREFTFSETCISPPTLAPEPSSGPLSWGHQGERVRALQRALIDRNLLFDEADGQFGPNTDAAVRDLEFLLGLEPDGYVDGVEFAELGL